MTPANSPIEYLAAFAIVFVAGVVCTIGFSKYTEKVRKEPADHVRAV